MINELYRLTVALDQADIATEHTHPKYKLIPKVTKKTPCIHTVSYTHLPDIFILP